MVASWFRDNRGNHKKAFPRARTRAILSRHQIDRYEDFASTLILQNRWPKCSVRGRLKNRKGYGIFSVADSFLFGGITLRARIRNILVETEVLPYFCYFNVYSSALLSFSV